MSSESGYLGKAGSALARSRLRQYRRYADLVASQEAALDADDLARFEELGEELLAIQQEIGPAGASHVFGDDEGEVAREAASVLQETLATAERVRARLASMRDSGAQEVRTAMHRRPQARRYVSEGAQSKGTSSKVDVTL